MAEVFFVVVFVLLAFLGFTGPDGLLRGDRRF